MIIWLQAIFCLSFKNQFSSVSDFPDLAYVEPVSVMLDPLLAGMFICCSARSEKFQSPRTVN